jgi:DNA-binding HxlR family transcriptional regulator
LPCLCFVADLREEIVVSASTGGADIEAFREAALSCPIPAAIEVIGEKWAFLIVRGAFNGLHHFEEFQAGLGIARNILSDRLGKLVAGEILQRLPDASDRRKVVYSLTDKGEALLPVMIALRQWAENWGHGEPDIVLADRRDRLPVRQICIQAQDGRELTRADLTWVSRSDSGGAASKAA